MTRTRILQIAGALILVAGIVILILWLTGVIFKKSAPATAAGPGAYAPDQPYHPSGGIRKHWLGGHGSTEQHRLG